MKIKPIYIRLIGSLFLFIIFLAGCKDRQASADGFESTLKSAYQDLALTKTGLDYPSQDALEICKKYRPNCTDNYSRNYIAVQNSKKKLQTQISANPERTLAFTLDTICQKCDQDEHKISMDNQQECLGSIVALFYFTQDEQDKIILDRLLNASPQVFDWLLSFRFEWYYNRPNPQRWIDAIKNIPDNKLNRDLKETMIQRIKDAKHDSEKFGVML